MIYDTLAMRWQHEHKSMEAVEKLCPSWMPSGLSGASASFDAQTDDARLVLRVLQEGKRAGGTALNYATGRRAAAHARWTGVRRADVAT